MKHVVALALAVLLCVPSWALRASAQAAEPSDADRAAALAMMQAGVQSAEDGDWEAALVAFGRAYRLVASTRVLMNLAGAQRHTGHLVDASQSYARWLQDATDRDEPYRATVEQALADLASETPQLTVLVRGTINGDVVEVDGNLVEIGATVQLDPGPHVAELLRDGAPLRSESFDLALSERREVTLNAASVAPTEAEDTAPPTTSILVTSHSDDTLSSPWLWGGIAAGAVIVIAVIIGVAVAASSSGGTAMPDMGSLGPFHL